MKIAYFDCFSGISGDMTLGALLDAGLDEGRWRESLRSLNVAGYSVTVERVVKEGIAAVQVDVVLESPDTEHGRHLRDIEEIIARSQLPARASNNAVGAFRRLARAEARIHGVTVDEIHFHEVGAVDAIVDICGACIALDLLDIERVYCSALPLNRGWVECAHGTMPVPAPATLELMAGFAMRPDARVKELTTPTGAALMAHLAERSASGVVLPAPPMTLERTGYGAGRRNSWIPNLLRVMIGELLETDGREPAGTRSVG